MILCTCNIGRTAMTPARVASDMQEIKSRLNRPVIGWQEVNEGDLSNEHRILRETYPNKNWHNVAMETRVPVTVNDQYAVLNTKSTLGTTGIAHVSPHRYITEVVIKPGAERIPRIVVMNMHYPAGAFNKAIEPTQRERMEHWQEMFRVHKKRLKYWADERGLTTFWMGDVNRMDMPKAHPDERQLVVQGIDSISVVIRETGVKVVEKGSFELHSDHDARWVQVTLS